MQTGTAPVCITAPGADQGKCLGCTTDFGSGAPTACQLSGQPYCFTGAQPNAGACGKCTSDADCTVGTHPGPKCEKVSGACGNACNSDADCKATEWCGQNVCIPKTPNSQPVTNVPPFTGECTQQSGQRTCLAAVCEESDDRCGLKNGSPCDPTKSTQCRSNICFDKDDLCGKPTGEPCGGNGECRSEKCENGKCAGCQEDTDCPTGQVCDKTVPGGKCIDGCRPGVVQSVPDASAEQKRGDCPPNQTCVVTDGGAIGKCEPNNDGGTGNDGGGGVVDAGDTSGIIEGGGCSCNTTTTAVASPFAISAVALGILACARRLRNRKTNRSSSSKSCNDEAP
jgi:Cys-rich repeat protein